MNVVGVFPTVRRRPPRPGPGCIAFRRLYDAEAPLIYMIRHDTELEDVLFSIYTKSRVHKSPTFLSGGHGKGANYLTLEAPVNISPASQRPRKSTSDTLEIRALIKETEGTISLKRPLQPANSPT